jgi:pyruvate formate lyase activating enzyme
MASIEINGIAVEVPEGSSIKETLEALDFEITIFPSDEGLFMPCQTGGCWSCAVDIDGELRPACVSKVQQGMKVKTSASNLTPRRIVGGFMGHRVGGVGTPWWLKGDYIEVACFTAGCNFCCPQCQNWLFTYMSTGNPSTPEEAARQMTATRKQFGVGRIAISGGECTLNRRWLVQYLSHLSNLNPGACLHVDTNGSILTNDYLDDLVEAGMTDIGIDLKALRISTFQEITGLVDSALASRYMETAWKAVKYLHDNHPMVFIGIGIPYNKDLIGLEEIAEMGRRIAEIDPWLQVCALDYRPEFKRPDLTRPSYWEMFQAYGVLRDSGLESVICQTEKGIIGPMGRLLP